MFSNINLVFRFRDLLIIYFPVFCSYFLSLQSISGCEKHSLFQEKIPFMKDAVHQRSRRRRNGWSEGLQGKSLPFHKAAQGRGFHEIIETQGGDEVLKVKKASGIAGMLGRNFDFSGGEKFF